MDSACTCIPYKQTILETNTVLQNTCAASLAEGVHYPLWDFIQKPQQHVITVHTLLTTGPPPVIRHHSFTSCFHHPGIYRR